MASFENLKPIYRSKLRVFLGKRYYRLLRYFNWYFGSKRYAKTKYSKYLENIFFSHRTPLYRNLRNVDMWLQHNKVENLKIALNRVNGILIKPGETFSYWKSIGNPTRFKGYKKGMNLYYGKFRAEIGGGLCQLSNLIYWMTLHTPLTVIERHRHSFDVFPDSNRTQPFGSGATCVYNYRDLQISNETNETYQISIRIEDEHLTGEIRTDIKPYLKYRVYEKEHKITHEYWGGYVRHNLIRREILDMNNKLIDDESICENHALMMYEPLLDTSKELGI
ncbi:VanW family protein [Brassicibacter mesophilus]|uniref:VanW family protein n=1 Tax=Brassicibacter mesophilus TaxID=745119 RepID=UPI003D1C9EEC